MGAMRTLAFRLLLLAAIAAIPSRASAQGFISPFLGYDVGGDAGTCPSLVHDCSEKKSGYGVTLGVGGLIGFEEDIAFAPDFYGKSATFGDNSVLTLMSNIAVKIPTPLLRPYASAGLGLMRSHVGLSLNSLTNINPDDNALGYNIGGGVMLLLPYHLGVRADVRTMRSLNDVKVSGVTIPNAKLNFSRISIGLLIH
jgi:hypothetical protein